MNPNPSPRSKTAGFTLIELLTVIAIIGILAGILFPATGAVRTTANNTKSRSQFTNWVASIETFYSEYRFYPTFGSSTGIISLDDSSQRTNFIETLSGRTLTGGRPAASSVAGTQNRRLIGFYSFGDGEFLVNDDGSRRDELADAFGNTDIVVAVDHNQNGRVFGDGQPSPPGVRSADGGNTVTVPSSWVSGGVRAGAVAYSAGRGRASRDIVRTWSN